MRAVAATLVLMLGVAACGGSSTAAPPKPTGSLASNAELLKGRELYASKCQRCHGSDGTNGSAPAFDGKKMLKTTLGSQILYVRAGRGVMPGFRSLSDEEIRAVVRYLREVLAKQ
jgi:cytochrome c oxidase subunit 2